MPEPTDAPTLLADLRRRGIAPTLAPDGRLVVPKGLTADLYAAVDSRREEMVALLKDTPTDAAGTRPRSKRLD